MSVRALLLRVALVTLGVALMTSAAAGYVVKTSLDDNNAAAANRLFAAQVKGCAKQNLRTQDVNTNALNTWSFDSLFASAVTHPQPGQSQSAAQKRLLKAFRARLLDNVASLTWTPINLRCSTIPTAVQLPVAFEKRLPSKVDVTPQGAKRLAELKATRRP